MPHFDEPLRIKPLAADIRKASMIGAEAILPTGMSILNLEKLSAEDRISLRNGVFENGVVVIRNQQGIDPATLPKIAKIFDETAWDIHSGGEKMVTDQKNILAQNRGARIPRAPQVSIIGKGKFVNYEGIPELDLKHVDHTEFHEDPHTTSEIADGFTRPYRWHMDAPLYERLPGVVTTLHSISNPSLPDQKIKFPDDEIMTVPAGATAFFSGARAFDLLSDEQKAFALNTTVQYAPRAYEWMRDCKATDDGLTIAKKGREKKLEDLEAWSWDKVHSFPMVWFNPHTHLPHLQVLGCCVYALETRDPFTGLITADRDLDHVRKICHDLLKKVYRPENIYAHRWEEGDLVIFHNRGVLHSITGQLSVGNEGEGKRRLFWQCSMASGTAPVGFVNM